VFVDFDNNLNAAVSRLREALDDEADHPRFIETLPRHGYRFIASVSRAPQASGPAWSERARLLVLPFVNASGDPALEYFSDAVTDEIITELARQAPEALAVIARTTTMRYRGQGVDVACLTRDLDLDFVVEGSARREGEHVRINVQLIRAVDQVHIWAQRYEAAWPDLFATEHSIAQAICRHTGLAPPTAASAAGTRTSRPPTSDLVAYNEYIRGRHVFGTVNPGALQQAKGHFEAALRRDPDFALAHDSLAEVYGWLGYFGFMRPADAYSMGMLSAARAIEIDSSLAETHALLAQYHKMLHYDWPEVERGMARALAMDPESGVVRSRHAWHFLMPQGRLEEAAAGLEFALERDPLAISDRSMLAITLLLARKFDHAVEEALRVVDLDPKAYWGWLTIGASRLYQGRFSEAIAAERRAVDASGGMAAMLAWLGLALALTGESAEARGLLARLHKMAGNQYVPPTCFAWIHLGLRELDTAFEWLDRAVDERDQFMMPIRSYGFFDPVRADPRFAALLHGMKLDNR